MWGDEMRASWTRDEVILGLDVLFSHGRRHLSMDSEAIIDLSNLLNRLPIIPIAKRNDTFRNTAGVSSQLSRFLWSLKYNEKHANIGRIFTIIYEEYKERPGELHEIAQAIRRNESVIRQVGFGASEEADGFPEGAILCHLHRHLEHQQGFQFKNRVAQCAICCVRVDHIYGSLPNVQFLEPHLLVPPTEISPDMTYVEEYFIMVCPNCHSILHQIRPWRNRKTYVNILQTL
ncbi:hypothetical protein [Desulfosporosinus sp. I2]|uniref:hypothetical protein n=1 Tax=Desulfosporosinus sp. I2 TaxID=1617025 RepID=UPI001A9A4E87|nr:hypothetical protein [Desulfosporosinus sp. I2]